MDDDQRTNGERPEVQLPRTERPDAPAYLRTYLDRRASADGTVEAAGGPPDEDSALPLYLRQYRRRLAGGESPSPMAAPIEGEPQPTWTEAWAATSKSSDVILPPEEAPPSAGRASLVDVHLIRHGETQGYSVNAGLTPMGRWQAHRRGHDLSKGVRPGASTLIVSAPSGEMDVTAAFREYHAVGERYERVALGDRPLWLVEIDRFVKIQRGGGDPIHFWMTVPLLSFEPATAVVLRFWSGITSLVAEAPEGGRVLVATHSGPIRAFATWALGHDAGEPYNVEEVRIRVRRDLTEAQVTYRNRTADVHVPPASDWPSWMRAPAVVAAEAGT
jgi:broad specificity phosphatase PhoE